jgi:hypothetical protein
MPNKFLSSEIIAFACYSASCRPPTSGGTGGSSTGTYKSTKGLPAKLRYQPIKNAKGQKIGEVRQDPGGIFIGRSNDGRLSVAHASRSYVMDKIKTHKPSKPSNVFL